MKLVDRVLLRAVIDPSGCWLWQGSVDRGGYGKTTHQGKHVYVHKAVYLEEVGPIPDGKILRHSCDHPECFNPAHLTPGTHKENTADMFARGRQHSRQGECSGMAKLTEEKVVAIRADKRLQAVIAAEHGIHQSLVSYVKSRKIWNHVK